MNPVNTVRVSTNYDQSRRLMDHLTTAVVLLDEQLKVQFVNPAAEQLMAASSSQLAGMAINMLIHDKDQTTQADLETALRGQVLRMLIDSDYIWSMIKEVFV